MKKSLFILFIFLGFHSINHAGYFVKQPTGGIYGKILLLEFSYQNSYNLEWYKDNIPIQNGLTHYLNTGDYGTGEYYVILTDNSGSIQSDVVTITPRTLTVSGITINNKIYDGITTATIDNWGTLQNKAKNSDDVSIDIITSTANFDTKDVGASKTVTANLVLTGTKATNYTLTQPSGLTADILFKDITDVSITVDNIPSGQVYTGTAIKPIPIVSDGGTTLIEDTDYTLSYSGNTNVGTATVAITGTGNYNSIKEITFSIAKADPQIIWPAMAAITYGESLSQAVLSSGSGAGTFAFRDGALTPLVSDSDVTDYVLRFTPTDNSNYNTLEKTNMKVMVSKANPVITWPASASITYGENLSQAVLSGGSGGGTFAFRDGTLEPSVSNSGITDYVMVFTPTDAANYNTLEKTNMKVTVNKIMLTVTAHPLSMPYGTDPATYQAGNSYDISGFVNNENEAVLAIKPIVSIDASITATTPAGNYTDKVLVSGASATNYNFTYMPNTLTITQAASGHITFDSIPSKTYGNAPFNLNGRHALGKTITYESNSSIVTVSNSGQSWTATIHGAGTATITARFAGDNDVKTETVQQIITIGKAALMITARPQERAYGQPNPDINNAYDFGNFINAGDENLFTSLPQAAIDPQYDAVTRAGTYPGGVLVSGGSHPYYNLGYTGGTLTINPAVNNIFFTSVGNKTYGDADFNLTATYQGDNPVLFESLNTDVIEVYADNGVTKARILKAGTAVLRAYSEASNNYQAAEATQTVTVEKAVLTIRPHDKTRDFGEANPTLTLEFSGLKYNDNENSLGTIVVTTTADETSPAGVYPIIASGATNSNYTIVYNEGVLTVLSISTDITGISVDGETVSYVGNDFYTIAGCGNNSTTVLVAADAFAKVSINGVEQNPVTVSLPAYGDNIVLIEVKAQNGATAGYTLTINKPVPFNQLVKIRWNNTLTVINNPANNGGYTFTSYRWYRNGQEIGSNQSWSAGKDGEKLNPTDVYHVALTADGISGELCTCEGTVSLHSMEVKAYPNPLLQGQTLYVEANVDDELLKDAVIEVFNAMGTLVGQMKVQGKLTPIDIRYSSGIHFFKLKGKDGFNQTLKVAVQ